MSLRSGVSIHGKNVLKLWTIQPESLWEKTQQTQWLRCDGRYTPRHFREAYKWMRCQMKQRIPDCRGGYPVWAWHFPKPHKRDFKEYKEETKESLVRIEFVTAPKTVLLSGFDAWHAVINKQYIALDDEDNAHFKSQYGFSRPDIPLEKRLEVVMASWERIFDLDFLRSSGWLEKDGEVQAVIEAVHLSQIRKVEKI